MSRLEENRLRQDLLQPEAVEKACQEWFDLTDQIKRKKRSSLSEKARFAKLRKYLRWAMREYGVRAATAEDTFEELVLDVRKQAILHIGRIHLWYSTRAAGERGGKQKAARKERGSAPDKLRLYLKICDTKKANPEFWTCGQLGRRFKLSRQRIHAILNDEAKWREQAAEDRPSTDLSVDK